MVGGDWTRFLVFQNVVIDLRDAVGALQNLPTSGQGVIQVHCRVHVLWPNDFFELFRVEQPVLFSAVV